MKLDVEGLELEILADLIHSGAIKHLDNVHIEYHTAENDNFSIFRLVLENKKLYCSEIFPPLLQGQYSKYEPSYQEHDYEFDKIY